LVAWLYDVGRLTTRYLLAGTSSLPWLLGYAFLVVSTGEHRPSVAALAFGGAGCTALWTWRRLEHRAKNRNTELDPPLLIQTSPWLKGSYKREVYLRRFAEGDLDIVLIGKLDTLHTTKTLFRVFEKHSNDLSPKVILAASNMTAFRPRAFPHHIAQSVSICDHAQNRGEVLVSTS
jgi:hypothetical protein